MDSVTQKPSPAPAVARSALDGATFLKTLDSLPVGIAYIDAEQRYVFHNAVFQRWFDFPGADFSGHRVREVIGDDRYERVRPQIEAALAGEEQRFTGPVNLDRTRTVETILIPDKVGSDTVGFHLLAMDVTARQEAQTELEELAERHEALITAGLGGIALTEDGLFLEVSERFAEYAGCRPEEMVGQPVKDTLTPASYELVVENMLRGNAQPYRIIAKRRDGTTFPVRACGVEVPYKGRRVRLSSVVDVSERTELEREVLDAGGRIYAQIGRDLHDGLGQTLTGISLAAESIRDSLESQHSDQAQPLTEVVDMLRAAITQTRLLSRALAPVLDERTGLREALESLCSDIRKMTGVRCHVEWRASQASLSHDVATHLFRIAQEAVNNAIKHGKPSDVEISFEREGPEFWLTILDDGSGLRSDYQSRRGMGLKTMQYRADLVNATLKVVPRQSGGLKVICRGVVDEVGD